MSGFPIVDLVVGMIFIYFLLSIICSSAVEMILTGLEVRAKILGKWLRKIFDKEITQPDGKVVTLGQAIIEHCAVTALSRPGKAPSYIDAKNFTSSLLEKLTYNPNDPKSVATNISEVITAIENATVLSTELQRALLGYAYEARDSYAAFSDKTVTEIQYFRAKVENWFDTSMDRISGTFKKNYCRPVTFIIAIITAGALNADSIAIAKYLYSNPQARTNIAAQATKAVQDSNNVYLQRIKQMRATREDSVTLAMVQNNIKASMANISEANAALNDFIPLGWKGMSKATISPYKVITKITGLLATVLAIFMGAPFWFDLLNKIANLRGTGPKPASSTTKDN
jgi:hypothetical protein